MLVVTGLPRSGTTPVAIMLHRLGCGMGDHCLLPQPGPGFEFEWEDYPFTGMLFEHLCESLASDDKRTMPTQAIRRYIGQRAQTHRDLVAGRKSEYIAYEWGVKSAYLAPYVAVIRDQCAALGEPFKLVVTERPEAEIVASIEAQGAGLKSDVYNDYLETTWQLCEQIRQALCDFREIADLVVPIRDTWKKPLSVAQRLQALVGSQVDPALVIAGITDRQPSGA